MDLTELIGDLPPGVRLDRGATRGAVIHVDRPEGSAEVSLHGGHVLAWQPRDALPVLWLSPTSRFGPGAAIRGGIPLCFPWFGPRAGAPQHGFARTSPWTLLDVTADGPQVVVRLGLRDDPTTRALWPHPFTAVLEVAVGARLTVSLQVTNDGPGEVELTAALHTYLQVADLRTVELTGLEHAGYLDKLTGPSFVEGSPDPLRPAGPTDRVYRSSGPVVLHDPAGHRRIRVDKSGSASTVVWTPWADGARAMADVPDDAWTTMVCIEAAAVEPPVRLAPGASGTLSTTLTVEPDEAP
jgi:glucose-6-phosphate 1-epimerase